MSKRIPAHLLSRLMNKAWKLARQAAKRAGTPVRGHLSAAMRQAWEDFRFVIEVDRRRAVVEVAKVAAKPVIPAVVTKAVSKAQLDYAVKVAPRMAEELAQAFVRVKGETSTDLHCHIDTAALRFTGAPAEFWLGLRASRAAEDVAHILSARAAGVEVEADMFSKHAREIAALV